MECLRRKSVYLSLMVFLGLCMAYTFVYAQDGDDSFEQALEANEGIRETYVLSDPKIREEMRDDWEAGHVEGKILTEEEQAAIDKRVASRRAIINTMSETEKQRRRDEYYGEPAMQDEGDQEGAINEDSNEDESPGTIHVGKKPSSAFEKAASLSHLSKMDTTFGGKKFGDKKFGETRIFKEYGKHSDD